MQGYLIVWNAGQMPEAGSATTGSTTAQNK
jgi:hypothetical protein